MSKKVQKIAIIVSFVIAIGGSLTLLMTWKNIGFTDGFMGAWLSSFALCVLCIAPIGGVIAFMINRLVNLVFPRLSSVKKNIVFGLIMAVLMESIMAVVTTMNLHGFMVLKDFIDFWLVTFVSALPAGLAISVLMSLVIKPKLAAFWAKPA
ncbi:MAG: DUF2798 domain-containing protein [Gammaproteobacteria bacterium]|jgi:hypothetical protein|uniref:DUF2798 domain-containing protein n=1 Tax=Marinomonas TaxID=28253 RepID=UPI000C1EB010|nr:DUF2798 domain-containing protein [Marinomonas sp. BSi20584]MBU1294199.1 DUF2798 domain-containing protein [Gammaproteobacteria bacterium]MBU1468750.1 DUF2798 domain-containing protein [Gammaproteobacteria bacterium]MBU2022827.1 DUF2798 domain-containing protein [Gammaproteobacteria bacterium]MBU2236472.1 DUF2798 domain-containing protein [Gammaproteobacteria bacterium]MBU2320960.1 DUF2798 domain-containing protein [Gammaproteobacteria bacterium]